MKLLKSAYLAIVALLFVPCILRANEVKAVADEIDGLTKEDVAQFNSKVAEAWDLFKAWLGDAKGDILIFAIGLVVSYFIAHGIILIISFFVRRRAKRRGADPDKGIFAAIDGPIGAVIFINGAFFSAIPLFYDLSENSFNMVLRVTIVLLTIAFAKALYNLTDVLGNYMRKASVRTRNRMDDLLADLIRRFLKILIVIVAIFFIFQTVLGLNVSALLAGAGVVGLAIAFAAKDTLANIFGSIMIIVDKPFGVGDRVIVQGADGTVEGVGLRSTRIRSLDGYLYSVPNNQVADSVVENITKRLSIKYPFSIGLTYGTTAKRMEEAVAILQDIIAGQEGIDQVKNTPKIWFTDFKDWSLNISVTVWFDTIDNTRAQTWKHQLNLEILRRFNEAGLDFAFPSTTNYLVRADVSEEFSS